LAIFPAVFALGADPAAGPRLAFIGFPQILQGMPAGRVVGVIFFFLLSAAALTSMISLLEVLVAVATERMGSSRRTATILVTVMVFALGIPSALSYGLLSDWQAAGRPLLDAIDHTATSPSRLSGRPNFQLSPADGGAHHCRFCWMASWT
jgi:NSS family neurotransmitter:Na+ symporter